jgi:hypothetical protein
MSKKLLNVLISYVIIYIFKIEIIQYVNKKN